MWPQVYIEVWYELYYKSKRRKPFLLIYLIYYSFKINKMKMWIDNKIWIFSNGILNGSMIMFPKILFGKKKMFSVYSLSALLVDSFLYILHVPTSMQNYCHFPFFTIYILVANKIFVNNLSFALEFIMFADLKRSLCVLILLSVIEICHVLCVCFFNNISIFFISSFWK